MAIFYVNINNAYVAAGNGSLGTPFNYTELKNHISANPTGNHIYRLIGKRVLNSASESIFATSNSHEYNIEATDLTQPWRIENQGGGISIYSTPNLTTNIKDGIIKCSSSYLSVVNANLFNVYLINTINFSYDDITINSGSLKGCTLIGSTQFQKYENATINVKDSVIRSLSSQIRCNFDTIVNLNNCVVSVSEANLIELTGPYAQVGTFNVNTVQFSWVPAVALPTSIDLLSTDILEQTIAPNSTINDITVLASGTFTGYEAGLFGGVLRTTNAGIGAFTFVTLVPPTTETSNDLLVTIDGEEVVSVSYLADTDKDLTYLVYVDGTGNLKMNKVREPSVDDKLLGSGAVEN